MRAVGGEVFGGQYIQRSCIIPETRAEPLCRIGVERGTQETRHAEAGELVDHLFRRLVGRAICGQVDPYASTELAQELVGLVACRLIIDAVKVVWVVFRQRSPRRHDSPDQGSEYRPV